MDHCKTVQVRRRCWLYDQRHRRPYPLPVEWGLKRVGVHQAVSDYWMEMGCFKNAKCLRTGAWFFCTASR